jgi:hypothetical protein
VQWIYATGLNRVFNSDLLQQMPRERASKLEVAEGLREIRLESRIFISMI